MSCLWKSWKRHFNSGCAKDPCVRCSPRINNTKKRQILGERAGLCLSQGCIHRIFTLLQLPKHPYTYRRPTIGVLLDIMSAFTSVDRSILPDCLLKNGVFEKFVSFIYALCRNTSWWVRAHGWISPLYIVFSGVRQGCYISPFPFKSATDDFLKRSEQDNIASSVELLSGHRIADLEHADDIMVVSPWVVRCLHFPMFKDIPTWTARRKRCRDPPVIVCLWDYRQFFRYRQRIKRHGNLVSVARSLMNIRVSSGPKTGPWSTPIRPLVEEDHTQPTLT